MTLFGISLIIRYNHKTKDWVSLCQYSLTFNTLTAGVVLGDYGFYLMNTSTQIPHTRTKASKPKQPQKSTTPSTDCN